MDQYLNNYSKVMNVCANANLEFDIEEACKDKPPADVPSFWSRVLIIVISLIVIFLGIAGNSLTLAALGTTKHLRKRVSTILIMNLSTADLSYCVLAMPFNMLTYWSPEFWCAHPDLCSYTAYLRYSCAFLDWSCLALVALERYAKIVYWNSRFYFLVFGRKTVVFLIIFFLWVFHFCFLLLYLKDTRVGRFGYNPQVHRCDFYPKSHFQYARRVNFIIWTCPILLVIAASYLHIYIYAKKRSREVLSNCSVNFRRLFNKLYHRFTDSDTSNRQHSSSTRHRIQERDITLARTLFILICSYTFCVMPMSLANIFDYCDQMPELQTMAYCAYFPLYCINNVIYAICHREYRVAYCDFVHRWCPKWALSRLCQRLKCSCTSPCPPNFAIMPQNRRHYYQKTRKPPNLTLQKKDSQDQFLGNTDGSNNNSPTGRPIMHVTYETQACVHAAPHGQIQNRSQPSPCPLRRIMSAGMECDAPCRLKRQSAIRRHRDLRRCSSGATVAHRARGTAMAANDVANQAFPLSPPPPYTPTANKQPLTLSDHNHSDYSMGKMRARIEPLQKEKTSQDSRLGSDLEAIDVDSSLPAHIRHLQPILRTMSSSMQIGDIEIQTTSTIKFSPSNLMSQWL